MPKLVVGVLLAGVLISMPVGFPRYSVVFNTSQGVHVATLMSDDSWHVERLPPGAYAGQFDMRNAMPFWSADGRTLVFMMEAEASRTFEGDSLILSDVGTYDVVTRETQIRAHTRDAEALLAEGRAYDGFYITSLSPDGRYVWLSNTLSIEALLVDLSTGRIISRQPNVVAAAAWQTDRVFVALTDAFGLRGFTEQFVLSLPDGQLVADLPNFFSPDQGAHIESQVVEHAAWPDDVDVMVFCARLFGTAGYQTALGIVDTETWNTHYVDGGHDLQVSPDGRYVSYTNAVDELVLLDLKTREHISLDAVGDYVGWHGNVLVNVVATQDMVVTEDGENATVTYTEYIGPDRIAEQIIGTPEPIDRWRDPAVVRVSPDRQLVVVRYGYNDLRLYDREKGLIAGPDVIGEEHGRLSGYEPSILWGQNHVYFTVAITNSTRYRSVAVDAATGEITFAPEGYIWVGESPDGRWVLLAGGREDMAYHGVYSFPELLAYSPETGETVRLFAAEGEAVVFSQPILWSPVMVPPY